MISINNDNEDYDNRTIDLLELSQKNNFFHSVQNKILTDYMVPHITISLPVNDEITIEEQKIIKDLSERLQNVKGSKKTGKKLKNKTLHHHHLGFNFAYNIQPLQFLSLPSYGNNLYLYSIQLSNFYNNRAPFGVILGIDIPFEIKFKVSIKNNPSIEEVTIKSQFILSHVSRDEYDKIVKFNQLINQEIFKASETKFLIVPLTINALYGNYQINWNTISESELLYTHPYQTKSIDIKTENLYDKLFISKYKSNFSFYELYNVIKPNDPCDKFIDKICSYNNEYKEDIKRQYFNDKDYYNIKAINLLQLKVNNSCPAITTYRSYIEKFLGVDYIRKNVNESTIFLYVDFPKTTNDLRLYTKNSYNNTQSQNIKPHIYLHTIFTSDQLSYYFLKKTELYFLIKVPYIMNTFERFLYPYNFIIEQFPNNTCYINNNNYKFFLWALTPPSLLLNYNYDTIETLGDSILKFILTSHLFFNNLNKASEGFVEKERVKYINNKYLFSKGKEMKIYQYIITKNDSNNNNTHMELSEKTMADVIESTIGAFYLMRNDIHDCYNFISKCKICEYDIEEKVGIYTLDRFEHFDNFNYGKITLEDFAFLKRNISFIDVIKHFNIGNYNDINYSNYPNPTKMNDISDNYWDKLQKILRYKYKDVNVLKKAMRHISYNQSDPNDNYEKLELLGDSIVELYIILFIYHIYTPLMYHYHEKGIIYNSFENSIFNIDDKEKKFLFANSEKFNSYQATKIKSFLCSNVFMCKLSYILTLPYYFQFKEEKNSKREISNTVNQYLNKDNINLLIKRKLNEYENPKGINPKYIADIFEALVGSMYYDGGLAICMNFLHRIYRPFVLYCIFYFDDLKYSAINDFAFFCTNKYKTAPEFLFKTTAPGECMVEIFIAKQKLFEGKGASLEEAKANAAISALRSFYEREHINNNNNYNNNQKGLIFY